MNFIETKLKGCFIIEPALFADDRGYFFESFNEERFNKGIGKKVDFVQDNQSFSQHGVIRSIRRKCASKVGKGFTGNGY